MVLRIPLAGARGSKSNSERRAFGTGSAAVQDSRYIGATVANWTEAPGRDTLPIERLCG
jgi:hypothetical protein